MPDDNKRPTSKISDDNKPPTARKNKTIKSADKTRMPSPSDIILLVSDDNPLPTDVSVECLKTLNYVLAHQDGQNIKFKVAPDIPRPTGHAGKEDETTKYFLNLKDGRTFRLTMVSGNSLSSAKRLGSGGAK